MKIVVELSQVKIWKFGFLKLTSFAQNWCENVNHVFKKSTSGGGNMNFSRTVAGITKWFGITIEGYLSYILPKFEDLVLTSSHHFES